MENPCSVLYNQPIFALLPKDVKKIVINSFVQVSYPFGKTVVQEGEPADAFYILASGRARVVKMDTNGKEISLYLLRPGDTFGEMGLLSQTEKKRTATVRASSDILAYRLDSSIFRSLIENNPDIKEFFELQIKYRNLHNFFLEYTPFLHLPIAGLKTILSEAKEISVNEGEFIIRQGDEPGPMYIIEDGRLRVFTEENGNRIYRAFLRKGDFFGELSMFNGIKRSASVQAHSPCKLLLLMRESFKMMIENYPEFITQIEERISQYDYRCIANVPLDFNEGIFPDDIKVNKEPGPEHEKQEVEYSGAFLSAGPGPFASMEGCSVKRSKKKIKAFPYTWQGEKEDRASASLVMVCRYLGNNVSLSLKGKLFLHWLWPFFRPFKQTILKVLALTIAISAFQMSLPVFLKIIVDGAIVGENTGLLSICAVSMFSVLFLALLFMAAQRYLLSFAAAHFNISAMECLIRKILDLPMDYFNMRHRAEIQNRIAGIRPLLDFLVKNSINILGCIVQLSIAIILMFFYSPKLGLIFLTAVPIYLIIIKYFAQRLKVGYNFFEEFFRKHLSSQLDILQGIENLKAMGAEDAVEEKALALFQNTAQPLINTNFNFMFYDGVIRITTFLPMALFGWLGAYQVISARLTIGGLVAFCFFALLANESITGLLSVWQNMQSVSGPSSRLNDIFEQDPEQGVNHSDIKPVRTFEGKIRFQKVGFQYGGPGSPKILTDISFEVPPGKKVAIVGRNSSGKTTLIKCLAGLLEPTEGTIFYDNIDLKRINHRDLRKHFGIVLQENYIFDGTIANNIALGEKDPDMDQILRAARLSNAHVFIENLLLGYDTRVGERGMALSASQRQCIAIARAVYHNPSILVFDNATNFLDKYSEKAFKENMKKLMEGRTCFIIENDMKNIEHADIIIVLEKGKLAEQGSHDELIRLRNIYYYLYNLENV
ncbi:MAG: peptidase domain-containing ABC transporter [bacterium]